MPQNITDVNAFTSPVTSVADGDGATGANFLLAPQALANRTYYLQQQLQKVLLSTDTGVRLIRPFASAALLRASTDHTDGQICQVYGVGIFQYNSSSGGTDDALKIITPTDVGAGSGRWLLLSPWAVANGLATLDGTTKLTTGQRAGWLVSGQIGAGDAGTTVTTTATAISNNVTLTAVAGDILIIGSTVHMTPSSTVGATSVNLRVQDGGVTSTVTQGLVQVATASNVGVVTFSRVYVVANSGTIIVSMQAQCSSGTATILNAATYTGNAAISVAQYRP
jgi:hypothetical protein